MILGSAHLPSTGPTLEQHERATRRANHGRQASPDKDPTTHGRLESLQNLRGLPTGGLPPSVDETTSCPSTGTRHRLRAPSRWLQTGRRQDSDPASFRTTSLARQLDAPEPVLPNPPSRQAPGPAMPEETPRTPHQTSESRWPGLKGESRDGRMDQDQTRKYLSRSRHPQGWQDASSRSRAAISHAGARFARCSRYPSLSRRRCTCFQQPCERVPSDYRMSS